MIQNRGADRYSLIVGSSIHNQQIEILWKDVLKSVTSLSTLWSKMTYFTHWKKEIYLLCIISTFHVLTELSLVLRQVGIIIPFTLLKINHLTSFLVLECFSCDILDSQHRISFLNYGIGQYLLLKVLCLYHKYLKNLVMLILHYYNRLWIP